MSLGCAWKDLQCSGADQVDEPTTYQAGLKVRVDREAVRRSLEAKPDLYLRKLQAELKVVGELGFRVKKVAPRLRARHRSKTGSARAFVEQLRSIPPERLAFSTRVAFNTDDEASRRDLAWPPASPNRRPKEA